METLLYIAYITTLPFPLTLSQNYILLVYQVAVCPTGELDPFQPQIWLILNHSLYCHSPTMVAVGIGFWCKSGKTDLRGSILENFLEGTFFFFFFGGICHLSTSVLWSLLCRRTWSLKLLILIVTLKMLKMAEQKDRENLVPWCCGAADLSQSGNFLPQTYVRQ